jgi:hypothetical protein
MSTFNFKDAKYTVSGIPGMTLDEALKLWKTKYPSIEHFTRDVVKTDYLKPFSEFVKDVWDDIIPITAQEAFAQKNSETRRIYFDCLGVEKLFNSLSPDLLDRQVIKKKRRRWDDKNDPYDYEFEDVYELYGIKAEKLFPTVDQRSWRRNSTIFTAVRCWCTTTNREYWIYVPEEAALKDGINAWANREDKKYDAIKAIAWTIRIDITEPERIYRQGDIIIAKESEKSKKLDTPYHISKDQYLKCVYSET